MKGKKNETQTIFIILRPTVTTYEVEGLQNSLPTKTSELLVGSDGQPWTRPEGDYRGTNMFGGTVDKPGPVRRRSMAQPETSDRSEESSGGEGCVSTCRFGGSPVH